MQKLHLPDAPVQSMNNHTAPAEMHQAAICQQTHRVSFQHVDTAVSTERFAYFGNLSCNPFGRLKGVRLAHELKSSHQLVGGEVVNRYGSGTDSQTLACTPPEALVPKKGHHCGWAARHETCAWDMLFSRMTGNGHKPFPVMAKNLCSGWRSAHDVPTQYLVESKTHAQDSLMSCLTNEDVQIASAWKSIVLCICREATQVKHQADHDSKVKPWSKSRTKAG